MPLTPAVTPAPATATSSGHPALGTTSPISSSIAGKTCRQLVMPCPEDVAIDHAFHRVYISSCPRPRMFHSGYLGESGWRAGALDLPLLTQPSAGLVGGAILTLDLKELDGRPVNRTAPLQQELGTFRPIGIDLFIIDSTQARLFATDRPRDGHARVVVFDVDRKSGALSRPRIIEDDRFIRAPNEIAAVSADAFYLTNSQAGRYGWQQMIENVIPIGLGSVVHGRMTATGACFRVVEAFKHYPNGVAFDRVANRLYVAAPSAKKVVVYDVAGDPADPRLVPLDAIDVPVAADNLTWDAQGNLWVAGSPDLMTAVIYLAGDRASCPSEVVRIADPGGAARVETVFRDDGQLISSASVGAYHEAGSQRQLVIGAPFQDRLLIVDL